jgi:uncharacterized protein
MELENYFRGQKAYVWKEKFAFVKAKAPDSNAFAVIKDKNETTLIIEQSKVKKETVIEIEKDFRLITFDLVLPFGLVGFIAKVSKALAEERISIYPVSSYSTDHMLVKDQDINESVAVLKKLGFEVTFN